MRKILATALLLTATAVNAGGSADKVLPVPNSGVVPANGGILSIPLTPMLANVFYTLECTIAAENPSGVVFSVPYTSNRNSNSEIFFYLNGNRIYSNQGMLEANDHNKMTTSGMSFFQQSDANTVSIQNADETPIQVTKCVAHFVAGVH